MLSIIIYDMRKSHLFLIIILPAIVFSQDGNGSIFSDLSPLKYSRYNRVQGIFPGGELKLNTFDEDFFLLTRFGYGISDKEFRYILGIENETNFEDKNGFRFLFFNEVRTNDEWIIGPVENTLASLFLKEDFMDYFAKKGSELVIRNEIKKNIFLGGEIGLFDYESVKKKTDWALFGGSKAFRDNPEITEGRELYFKINVGYDNRETDFFVTTSTILDFYLETGSQDFDYTGFGLTLQKYQDITFTQRLSLRFMLKCRRSALDEQHLFDLGGIGSLRGYRFKEFTGNYMQLFNLDYSFGGDLLQKLPLQFIPTYESASLVLFMDIGSFYLSQKDESYFDSIKELVSENFKSSLGISISLAGDLIRFDFARRLDSKKAPMVFTARFLKSF